MRVEPMPQLPRLKWVLQHPQVEAGALPTVSFQVTRSRFADQSGITWLRFDPLDGLPTTAVATSKAEAPLLDNNRTGLGIADPDQSISEKRRRTDPDAFYLKLLAVLAPGRGGEAIRDPRRQFSDSSARQSQRTLDVLKGRDLLNSAGKDSNANGFVCHSRIRGG